MVNEIIVLGAIYIIVVLVIIALYYVIRLLQKKYGIENVNAKITWLIQQAELRFGPQTGPEKKSWVINEMIAFLLAKKIIIPVQALEDLLETTLSLWQIIWKKLEKGD